MNFNVIKTAVAKQFATMTMVDKLFSVDVSGDELWATYINAFTVDEDPLYRERTTHDCQCCRAFIKAVGNLVTIDEDGKVTSIWDIDAGEYQHIVDAMAKLVHGHSPVNRWFSPEVKLGIDHNFGEVDGERVQFTHFFVNVPAKHVVSRDQLATLRGTFGGELNVFRRALTEFSLANIDDVLYLINNDLLYRGAEHRNTLVAFREAAVKFSKFNPATSDAALLALTASTLPTVIHVRNSVIGSLLVDLSDGVELDTAVAAFERKVAGDAYKRPKAIYTEKMKKAAADRVEELGLTSALARRLAVADDISAGDVLFLDGVNTLPADTSPFDVIADSTKPKTSRKTARGRRVTVDEFTTKVLPNATSLEVLVEGKHAGNLASLTTSVDPTAGRLFAWDNNFAWAYTGNNADSVITQRVKAAGGVVDAPLCFRLAWFNTDDYDLHLVEPDGNEIYFGRNKSARCKSILGGCLDVDMNVGGESTTPVENIFYENLDRLKTGNYRLFVNNYTCRNRVDFGFDVELQVNGQVTLFSYRDFFDHGKSVDVLTLHYDSATKNFTVVKSLDSHAVTKTVWGVETEQWCPVKLVTKSPNFWNDQRVGNEHTFFILKDCASPEPVRGFFNEYLRPELRDDRKVFEALGAKLTAAPDADGLAGLGFTRGSGAELQVLVHGAVDHVVTVEF